MVRKRKERESREKERMRETTGIMKRKKLNIKNGNNIIVGHEGLEACTWRSEETVAQNFHLKHCSRWRLQRSQRNLRSCNYCGTKRSL